MRVLFCCEFYAPSVGGVQEVVRQISERLVKRGHQVTVATTKLPSRTFDELNGVQITEFSVSGNSVRGMSGELDVYRQFVTSQQYDVIIIKAAQQWTFDALWPVLPQVRARKIFIPCGFSNFYEPNYADYFQQMPGILRRFDHLIFYAADYRDINFARQHGINNFSIIPNGADESEFFALPAPSFRQLYGIEPDDFLFLTVGSFTGFKGHDEVIDAFAQVELDCPSALILNGNLISNLSKLNLKTTLKKYVRNGLKGLGLVQDIKKRLIEKAKIINEHQKNKKVLFTDLPRPELVQAFMNADLFVFASNIEYSPLVLYEAAAAGTPFLSVPVGNAEEIARWTGAGEICPAPRDEKGYTKVDPHVLAEYMARMVKDKARLNELGATGKRNWALRFTWDKISVEYEKVLLGV